MLEDDNRAVIEMIAIIREGMNRAIKRRANLRTRFGKEIHAEMNGAPFVGGPVAGCELRRIIECSSFVVATDPNRRSAAAHFGEDCLARSWHLGTGGIGSEKCAAHAEIENMQRCVAKIAAGKLQHRAVFFRASLQSAPHGRGLRYRLQ